MNYSKFLLIRADADTQMGSGHVMRCLALAEAWQDCGGEVLFVHVHSSPSLRERISSEKMEMLNISSKAGSAEDALETVRAAKERNTKWIVVDGYHFGAEYQKIIKNSGFSLFFIDDYGHSDHYYADIVLNQNNYADMTYYNNSEPTTLFLLGTKYILLRKEFLIWANYQRTITKEARKVLVTFGGADKENITFFVIEALKRLRIDNLEVIAILGGLNPNGESLNINSDKIPGFSLRRNIRNMPELMAWADIAISSGGTTCWELAFMGLPTILCAIAENQKSVVNNLKQEGIVKCLGKEEILNADAAAEKIKKLLDSYNERFLLYQRMKKLVDGKGALRVCMLISSHDLQFRNATKTDLDLIFSWINDPLVRSNSFNSSEISKDEHEKWFSAIITDKNTIYYIALDMMDQPVGQARFHKKNSEAVISVLLEKNHRGFNLGSGLISGATKRYFKETDVKKINAYIKIDNNTSLRSFLKAGYKQEEIVTMDEQAAYHLIKVRDVT